MRALAVTALLALTLGGCASLPPPSPATGRVSASTGWVLQGRIGVQSGEQNLSGHIHWSHHGDVDDVLMTSPLGQGVARIVRDAAGVVLELPNQPVRRARSAETLTRETLGYVLPVDGLAWWVQARPDPSSAFEASRDAQGRLAQLKQDGWTIDYLQYAGGAPDRPRKLVVKREGLEIRLVADDWQDQ